MNATASHYNSLLWTSSGTGTFSNPALLNPVYTPSAADILNGSVILTLTATSASPCVSVADQMIMHITKQAFAYAGPDHIICETQGSYTLASATASNYVSILWTTSGTGTFSDPEQLTPVYTPSADDIASGSVRLTLTAFGIAPCVDSTSSMVLTISRQAIANAGSDETICFSQTSILLSTASASFYNSLVWTTSGSGTFNDPNIQNPVYFPSANDIAAGTVVLTLTATSTQPCVNAVSSMTLTIIPELIASAGPDVSACAMTPYQITGATAANYSSLLWTYNGSGTLLHPTTINPTYIPAQGESGNVTFTLHAYSIQPCNDSIVDQMIMTIYQLPTGIISLHGRDTICGGDTVLLRIDLTGIPPWTLTLNDGYTDTTFTIGSTPYFLNLFPPTSRIYTITSISDTHCNALPSGLSGMIVVDVHPKPGAEFTWQIRASEL